MVTFGTVKKFSNFELRFYISIAPSADMPMVGMKTKPLQTIMQKYPGGTD